MSYLVDTNVVCELIKPKPSLRVMQWFDPIPDESIYICALSLGEIRKGIEKVASGRRKEKLRVWLEHELPEWFDQRVVDINSGVCDRWGRLVASSPKTLPAIDSLIAATALHYDLSLVTRNVEDFNIESLEVINPWL